MQFLASHELSVSATPPEILAAASAEDDGLRLLLLHWQRETGAAAMPLKPCIGREIGPLLKRIHLSDVIEEGRDFRFRLLGDAVFQCIAVKQTGCLVSEHPDMGVRLRYPVLMREVVRQKTPLRGLAMRISAHFRTRIESLWLPYGDGAVTQIMGMSASILVEERLPSHEMSAPV
jgi:hypothetical protein